VREFSAKHVIAEAWHITQENQKKLFWYGFIPSFFSIAVGVTIVYFQVQLFISSKVISPDDSKTFLEVFSPLMDWLFSPEIPTSTLIIFGVLTFLGAFFLPVFSEGAIVAMTHQYKKEGVMKRGMGKGFIHFLPLFKFSIIKNSFKPFSVIFEFFFVLRFLGTSVISLLEVIFGVIFFLGLLGVFFFTYTAQFIVVERMEVGSAMMKSLKKVVLFFWETMTLILLFLLIEIRVLFNVCVILLLPFVMITIGGLIAHSYFGYIAEGVVAIIVLSIAATLSGTLFILGNVAWTIAHLELKEIQEKEI
jgi:hypothetical protein